MGPLSTRRGTLLTLSTSSRKLIASSTSSESNSLSHSFKSKLQCGFLDTENKPRISSTSPLGCLLLKVRECRHEEGATLRLTSCSMRLSFAQGKKWTRGRLNYLRKLSNASPRASRYQRSDTPCSRLKL